MKLSRYNKIVPIRDNMSILYNSLSGAYILVNNEIAESITNKDLGKLSANHPSLMNELSENGIIVDDDVDERELVENLRLTRRFSQREYNLTINPTMNCNLNCWYCYETHNSEDYMTDTLIEKIEKHIRKQHEISNFDVLTLGFFGGEPLLKRNMIIQIFQKVRTYCENEGIRLKVQFTTNGTLLTKKFLSVFKDVNTLFQITLDGNREKHNSVRYYKESDRGSYDKIIENMKMLTDILDNYKLIVRINFDGKTLAGISEILKDLDPLPRENVEIGVHKVWQVSDDTIDYELLFDFIHYANQKGFVVDYSPLWGVLTHCCYADNICQAVINYDGNVFKCTARDFTQERREGYLDEEGNIIWSASKVIKRMSTRAPNICRECLLYPSCYGICSQNLLESNDSDECRMSKDIDINDIIRINFSQFLIKKNRK